jgi:ankyrin repeat protein
MNTIRITIRLASMVCLLAPPSPMLTTYAQQPGATLSIEQEFFNAIKKGESEKVGELLKQRPALLKASTKNGTTPVLLAVYAGHPEIAESLLATGVEPSIFEAAATGRTQRVRELLKKYPELVKAYSPDGWTALHLNWGHLDIVELLLDNGADINAVSKNRLTATPLQGAVVTGRVDLARLLISRGANVNCRGEEGTSPLHESAGSGQMEFVRLLLAHGANINARDDSGKTPLTIALEYKQAEIAKLLREHGGVQ